MHGYMHVQCACHVGYTGISYRCNQVDLRLVINTSKHVLEQKETISIPYTSTHDTSFNTTIPAHVHGHHQLTRALYLGRRLYGDTMSAICLTVSFIELSYVLHLVLVADCLTCMHHQVDWIKWAIDEDAILCDRISVGS